MNEPDEFLLEAMREVDALTPACPPIAPQPSPTYRREEWLASLVVPDAPAAEVRPYRAPPRPGYRYNDQLCQWELEGSRAISREEADDQKP